MTAFDITWYCIPSSIVLTKGTASDWQQSQPTYPKGGWQIEVQLVNHQCLKLEF